MCAGMLYPNLGYAQEEETTLDTFLWEEGIDAAESWEENSDYMALSESQLRSFNDSLRQAYLKDPDYAYDRAQQRNEFFQEAKRSFWQSIADFFRKKRLGDVSLIQVLLALVMIFTVFFVVLSLLGVSVGQIFKRKAQDIHLFEEEQSEDLQNLDFDALLKEAESKGDYRRGVRLLYLETLKMLGEKGIIAYAKSRTNYEYLLSMQGHNLYTDFESLTLKYDYVWYGNFDIDGAGFQQMRNTFRHFQTQLNGKA